MTHSVAVKTVVRRIAFLESRIQETGGGRRDRQEIAALLFVLNAMRDLLAKVAEPGKEVRDLRVRVATLEAEAKTSANRLNKAKAKLRAARSENDKSVRRKEETMETKLMGPLARGEWEIYQEPMRVEVAVFDNEDWSVVAVTKQDAQHLRDFAWNLERAADYLEGK